jgi:hypothetical protein
VGQRQNPILIKPGRCGDSMPGGKSEKLPARDQAEARPVSLLRLTNRPVVELRALRTDFFRSFAYFFEVIFPSSIFR